jgi:hypothetical protein
MVVNMHASSFSHHLGSYLEKGLAGGGGQDAGHSRHHVQAAPAHLAVVGRDLIFNLEPETWKVERCYWGVGVGRYLSLPGINTKKY